MKKKILATVMMVILAMSLVGPAMAVDSNSTPKIDVSNSVLRAEQTEWHYRLVGGKLQMRLWSITEGMWLTDWIDC